MGVSGLEFRVLGLRGSVPLDARRPHLPPGEPTASSVFCPFRV